MSAAGIPTLRKPRSVGRPAIEVGTIPSGSVLLQRLKPNVTTMSDDGTTIRWETRGGLLLAGDAIGVDPLMLLLASQIFN